MNQKNLLAISMCNSDAYTYFSFIFQSHISQIILVKTVITTCSAYLNYLTNKLTKSNLVQKTKILARRSNSIIFWTKINQAFRQKPQTIHNVFQKISFLEKKIIQSIIMLFRKIFHERSSLIVLVILRIERKRVI